MDRSYILNQITKVYHVVKFTYLHMENTQNVKNSDRPLWYLTSDNSISTYLKLNWEFFFKTEKTEIRQMKNLVIFLAKIRLSSVNLFNFNYISSW